MTNLALKSKTLFFAALLLFSCSPKIPHALKTTGKPLLSEQDRVFIQFEDVVDRNRLYAGEWFYFPNLGLINVEGYRARIVLEKIK